MSASAGAPTGQTLSAKEVEILVAVLKQHGEVRPSWIKIDEMGLLPAGMTTASAASTWFKIRRKLDLDGGAPTTEPDGTPKKKRGRPPKTDKRPADGEANDTAVDGSPCKKRQRRVGKKPAVKGEPESPEPLQTGDGDSD